MTITIVWMFVSYDTDQWPRHDKKQQKSPSSSVVHQPTSDFVSSLDTYLTECRDDSLVRGFSPRGGRRYDLGLTKNKLSALISY